VAAKPAEEVPKSMFGGAGFGLTICGKTSLMAAPAASQQNGDLPMTQSPLGTNQGPGPFDEAGPGQPDAPGSGFSAAPELSDDSRAGEPDSTLRYGTDPYPATVPDRNEDNTSAGADSTADTAKAEARQVAGTAVDSGKEVAATAKEEAATVAAEAKQQAASLFDTVRAEAGAQAGTQQQRIAEALHSLSKELGGMASSSQESGPLTDLAHQASHKGGEVAHWLQDREPADVLDAVRSYARRRPVTFLALCGVAGIVAGRLTRSTVANRTSLDTKDDTGRPDDRPQSYTPSYSPAASPADYPATGVYGGSVETTAAADPAPYPTETSVPGSGYGVDPNRGLR